MNKQTQIGIMIAAVLLACFCVAAYGVSKAVVWVRELPERIEIDEAAIGQALGNAINESYRQVLAGEDTEQTLLALSQLQEAAADNPEAASWIRTEFYDQLVELVESDQTEVKEQASAIVTLLDSTQPALPLATPE